MCAYNRVNQTSACHNSALLGSNGLLRAKAGFRGYVVSDWGATHDSAADNANAGLDMEYVFPVLSMGQNLTLEIDNLVIGLS
jgi:beta-glucosidase